MATLTPHAADAFVDSIGVNAHSGWGTPDRADSTNAYGKLDWTALVKWLGVRYVRDGIYINGASGAACIAASTSLQAAGIKELRIVTSAQSLADLLAGPLPKPLAVEPYNEWDSSGPSATWAADLAAFQPTLYSQIKGKWPDVPVLTPSFAQRTSYGRFLNTQAAFTTTADASSVHIYARPAASFQYSPLAAQSLLSTYTSLAPSAPMWVTESGYVSGVPGDLGVETDELAAARLLPRTLLYLFASVSDSTVNCSPYPTGTGGLGAAKSFVYELLDQHAQTYYTSNAPEDRFGLFRANGQPKLPAVAIRNMIRLLADPGPAPTLTPLDVTLGGIAAVNCSFLLFQKRDGSYWLAFWYPFDAVPFPSGGVGQVPPSGRAGNDIGASCRFTFLAPFASATIYRPMQGLQPTSVLTNVSVVNTTAYTDVQLIRLGSSPVDRTSTGRRLRQFYETRSIP